MKSFLVSLFIIPDLDIFDILSYRECCFTYLTHQRRVGNKVFSGHDEIIVFNIVDDLKIRFSNNGKVISGHSPAEIRIRNILKQNRDIMREVIRDIHE